MNSLIRSAILSTFKPAAAAAAETDANFKQTVLLLHGDGTNGAQNQSFSDSSTNNFSITRNGNTTQGTFSPFSQAAGYWSNYFDGTGDYIGATYNSAFDMNTYATFECWVNFSALSADRLIFGKDGFWINYSYTGLGTTANKIGFSIYNGSNWTAVSSTTTPQIGQWIHIAGVRDNTTLRIYINGIQEATASFTTSPIVSSYPLSVGGNANEGGGPITAYVSNARYCNGATSGALPYTGNFTPSTTPLTAISSTVFLSCQSNRFIDNSTNAFAITAYGNASIQAFSPFAPTAAYSAATNGGSGYFDGSGDYLTCADNSAFELGSSDFTAECWVYPTGSSGSYYVAMAKGGGGNSTDYSWQVGIDNNGYPYGVMWANGDGSGSFGSCTGSSSILTQQWYHLAYVRNGSSFALFVNGTRVATATSSSSAADTSASFAIGASRGTSNANEFKGYISNARLVKGNAVYSPSSSTITVPTALLTAITNTSFLCNFTNAGIIDNTGKNVLETVGNAQIDTGTKKFGTGSLEFDGTGDYLFAPSRSTTSLEGDFTIEAWAYLSSTAAAWPVITIGDSNTSTGIELYRATSTGKWRVYNNNTSQIESSTNTGTGSWVHLAIVRSSGSVKLYIDGTNEGSAWSTTGTFSGAVYVGAEFFSGSVSVVANGYIDDLRITKGVARYTANTSPPTKAFADL